MLVLRAVTRLVTILLLAALALAGLVVAVCSIGSEGTLSLPWLADQLQLPDLREEVRDFLDTVEAPGPIALGAGAAGLAAMIVGLALLAGALWPRRQRLAILERDDTGTLGATRRALGRAAASLVDGVHGLSARRVKLRPRRRGVGARLEVRATRPETLPTDEARRRADRALHPLAESFSLRPRIRTRSGSRVM
jgi:hypothetical protein